jgi:hypothetical protein
VTKRSGTLIGTLGGRGRARVDAHGGITSDQLGWSFEWWIGGDDRWYVPEREATIRQTFVGDSPVVRTAVRVPGGDAVQYAYGATAPGVPDGTIVVEFENDSPAPFVVALVMREARAVGIEGSSAYIDRRRALVMPRAPSRWSVAKHHSTDVEVCSGAAREGDFPSTTDRGGRIEAAFLHPVPHRARIRVAIALGDQAPDPGDLDRLPSPEAIARGWAAQLDRGMRVEVPDDRLVGAVRSARAHVLLAAGLRRPSGNVVGALEDWGFDAEAAAAWPKLSGRDRRRAGARPQRPASWKEVEALLDLGDPALLLLGVRGLLAFDDGDEVTLLADLPPGWLGQGIEVHDAPTRLGPVSYAVRWHGDRPALLWEAPPGVVLFAPGLDPGWSSDEPAGDALLAGPAT